MSQRLASAGSRPPVKEPVHGRRRQDDEGYTLLDILPHTAGESLPLPAAGAGREVTDNQVDLPLAALQQSSGPTKDVDRSGNQMPEKCLTNKSAVDHSPNTSP